LPLVPVTAEVPVPSGLRVTGKFANQAEAAGGQFVLVSKVLVPAEQAAPAFCPVVHVAGEPTHLGHGDAELPVRYTRDERGIVTLEFPAAKSTVPLPLVWTTLTTQVLSPAFTIGRGAAKKQLASSAQLPALPPQLASAVQATPKFVEPMQCELGPAPTVQFWLLVPVLATRVLPPGGEIAKTFWAPSGVAPGGTEVAPPPPM
jgi:hypothetical protein